MIKRCLLLAMLSANALGCRTLTSDSKVAADDAVLHDSTATNLLKRMGRRVDLLIQNSP